jgi:lon-related putative ATP-dependent protease
LRSDTSKLELKTSEVAFDVCLSKETSPTLAEKGKAGTGLAGTGRAGAETEEESAKVWGSEVIGQPRALEALKMGIGIHSKGYNIYVSGEPGTGRQSAVRSVLKEATDPHAKGAEAPKLVDIAFVYNFETPLSPRALRFPAGQGREFKHDIHHFIEAIKRIVALQAESDSTKSAEVAAQASLEAEENKKLSELEAALAADGFRAVQVEGESGVSMDIVPLASIVPTAEKNAPPESAPQGAAQGAGPEAAKAEEPAEAAEIEATSFEALQDLVTSGQLAVADYDRLRERWYAHMDRMKRLFAELRKGRAEFEASLAEKRDAALLPQVKAEIALLADKWAEDSVKAWIAGLATDVEERLYLFREPSIEASGRKRRIPALARYGINLAVDRSGADRRPVVFESHPSAANLFGFIEPHSEDSGETRSSYLRIRAGSYLQASGGFLVLRAEDVVADEEAWLRLKRALQDCKVEIQPRDGPQGATAWLKPEPVDTDVKVIMIGGESSYDLLYQGDPDFQKLFKIHAEFDSSMPRNAVTLRDYAAFIKKIVADEGLLLVSESGLNAVAAEGVRLSEYRTRLSTRFGAVADLLREADYRARSSGRGDIDGDSVRAAVAARSRLASLPEEHLSDMIADGEIIIQVQGRSVGRVNGLAVLDRGYYAFGIPAVISAQVSPGEGGVINIEGESGLSGEIYDKAVLIVEGFLRSRYARDFPLAVTASICFEQSYTAVEGDSASSTAVYALLSAIAAIPLRQDIAVTGSVNQIGQIQPVGGVNEKIVGFYRVCSKTGLTGSQGVMIPRRNIVNLTLPREVEKAIEEGSFHLWAVSTIDEGIEVLASLQAGEPNGRGEFPSESFNGRVRRELQKMARTIKNYL